MTNTVFYLIIRISIPFVCMSVYNFILEVTSSKDISLCDMRTNPHGPPGNGGTWNCICLPTSRRVLLGFAEIQRGILGEKFILRNKSLIQETFDVRSSCSVQVKYVSLKPGGEKKETFETILLGTSEHQMNILTSYTCNKVQLHTQRKSCMLTSIPYPSGSQTCLVSQSAEMGLSL